MPRICIYGGLSICVYLLLSSPAGAQTTQGILIGRITDSVTGRPVAASVVCRNEATTASFTASVDRNGSYAVGSLSPGRYRVTVSAPQYQSQQARSLDLPVSGRVELNFRLRPLYDVWEAGQYRSWRLPESQQTLGYYGPDVDTSRVAIFNANQGFATPLDISLSDVVSNQSIESLPLLGRDVYAMLLLLPGVTSDTATARGLGFSVNGQRPSSSNYLLDGVENNNLLVTGPLSAAVPEFVEEYRISTANYSAEYGRTSGFLANAITREGTNRWHGGALFYGETDRLNANGFQENAHAIGRPPFTEIQPGFVISGPLLRNRLFLFGGFETLLTHGSNDPQTFALPNQAFIDSTAPTSYAGELLRKYSPAVVPGGECCVGLATIAPPTSLDRSDALLRLDYSPSERQQFFGRASLDVVNQHDLLDSPYPDFSTRFRQRSLAIAGGWISRLSPSDQNEFRVSGSQDSIRVDTPHSDVPTLVIDQRFPADGQDYFVAMPGKTNAYDYRNAGRTVELVDNWSRFAGRHSLKAGAGFLQRNIDLNLSVYPEGYLEFATLQGFADNQLVNLQAQFDRLSDNFDPVSPGRSYRYRQFDAFIQDSFHWSNRLTLDYGLRYEFFGAPVNVGTQKDYLIQLGGGADIENSIMTATAGLALPGSQPVYSSRPSNWAVRSGIAWDPLGRGQTVIRASYGIFYDRPFDNLWENVIQNRYTTGDWTFSQPIAPNLPLPQLEAAGQYQNFSEVIPALAFQPNLRTPRTQSAFLGVQQNLGRGIHLDVHAQASRSRQLITTDEVNRPFSVPPTDGNALGYLNPAIANYINYRANQGGASYSALVTAVRFQRTRFSGQASYTWSHSIDNQSEPLAGTFFDFNTFQSTQTSGPNYISSFTRQFASSLDRGNSDFDQRHNLVFFFTYRPGLFPGAHNALGLFRDWVVSGLGAVRSGLPFTVYAAANYTAAIPEYLINQRADQTLGQQPYTSQPANGGRVLLNAAAFSAPGPNVVGTSGRNEFFGPGLFNTDISLARTFRLPGPSDSLRMTVRADFYNIFNHANLNNPESVYGAPNFGVALYGRTEVNNGFPLLAPLNETARQVQILLRLDF